MRGEASTREKRAIRAILPTAHWRPEHYVYRQTIGDITIDAVTDGFIRFPLSVPGADMERFNEIGGFEEGVMLCPITTFLIRTGDRTIVVDTGMGPNMGRLGRMGMSGEVGLLPDSLAKVGVGLNAVDTVVFTHLHSDHIGWNTTSKDGGATVATFPGARYVVNELELANADTVAGKSDARRLVHDLVEAGKLVAVPGNHEVAPGIHLLPTPGHTAGHVAVLVYSGGQGAVITGDAAHHPGELETPEFSPSADADPVQSAQSRTALVERIEQEGLLVLGGHFPAPHAGRITRVEGKRRWFFAG